MRTSEKVSTRSYRGNAISHFTTAITVEPLGSAPTAMMTIFAAPHSPIFTHSTADFCTELSIASKHFGDEERASEWSIKMKFMASIKGQYDKRIDWKFDSKFLFSSHILCLFFGHEHYCSEHNEPKNNVHTFTEHTASDHIKNWLSQ